MQTTIQWQQVRSEFKRIWGYDDFRSPQGEIVQCLLQKRDALIVMPTGGGKSICFQLPALLSQGLTLVISPLVALMENQVQELHQRQLPAALLHSQLPTHQRRQILWQLKQQRLRLLYLSPETLLTESVWQTLADPKILINGLMLDEAHCLVQWGDTFRPAYRRLETVRSHLLKTKPAGTQIVIAAFTATADPAAQQTIHQVLQLRDPQIFRLNPYRPNLRLNVETVWTPKGRWSRLLRYIRARQGKSGLVYVRSRRDSEDLAVWLGEQGCRTAPYHAGLSATDRRRIEADWLEDRLDFVVCTSAFGMGINKPNVRWVVHFHAPVLISEYVQEVGRAGRDGQPAEAMTLISEPTGWFNPDDRQRFQFFQEKQRSQSQRAQILARKLPQTGEANAVARQFKEGAIALSLLHSQGQLQWLDPFRYTIQPKTKTHSPVGEQGAKQMLRYLHTNQCRWQFLLYAFGFNQESQAFRCGQCDRCLKQG
jgi:ATP-dependent DNA helicase RecQ